MIGTNLSSLIADLPDDLLKTILVEVIYAEYFLHSDDSPHERSGPFSGTELFAHDLPSARRFVLRTVAALALLNRRIHLLLPSVLTMDMISVLLRGNVRFPPRSGAHPNDSLLGYVLASPWFDFLPLLAEPYEWQLRAPRLERCSDTYVLSRAAASRALDRCAPSIRTLFRLYALAAAHTRSDFSDDDFYGRDAPRSRSVSYDALQYYADSASESEESGGEEDALDYYACALELSSADARSVAALGAALGAADFGSVQSYAPQRVLRRLLLCAQRPPRPADTAVALRLLVEALRDRSSRMAMLFVYADRPDFLSLYLDSSLSLVPGNPWNPDMETYFTMLSFCIIRGDASLFQRLQDLEPELTGFDLLETVIPALAFNLEEAEDKFELLQELYPAHLPASYESGYTSYLLTSLAAGLPLDELRCVIQFYMDAADGAARQLLPGLVARLTREAEDVRRSEAAQRHCARNNSAIFTFPGYLSLLNGPVTLLYKAVLQHGHISDEFDAFITRFYPNLYTAFSTEQVRLVFPHVSLPCLEFLLRRFAECSAAAQLAAEGRQPLPVSDPERFFVPGQVPHSRAVPHYATYHERFPPECDRGEEWDYTGRDVEHTDGLYLSSATRYCPECLDDGQEIVNLFALCSSVPQLNLFMFYLGRFVAPAMRHFVLSLFIVLFNREDDLAVKDTNELRLASFVPQDLDVSDDAFLSRFKLLVEYFDTAIDESVARNLLCIVALHGGRTRCTDALAFLLARPKFAALSLRRNALRVLLFFLLDLGFDLSTDYLNCQSILLLLDYPGFEISHLHDRTGEHPHMKVELASLDPVPDSFWRSRRLWCGAPPASFRTDLLTDPIVKLFANLCLYSVLRKILSY